eukprot:CAMPEP_0183482762 /NCGR_PEP_ID=MMETSP0370-20130417/177225_1 /TAXON_ID=268820 /ORGANISM="Peridinium aciculiferum, Strain PAER-2" /LENGTH=87 /DNA_ID=CAMNT_0025675965 /DNA_START=325 /DNA_END=588 /DNA_ORIENTATION=+
MVVQLVQRAMARHVHPGGKAIGWTSWRRWGRRLTPRQHGGAVCGSGGLNACPDRITKRGHARHIRADHILEAADVRALQWSVLTHMI